jgi:tetratricopeptide (TPR) repeat protein
MGPGQGGPEPGRSPARHPRRFADALAALDEALAIEEQLGNLRGRAVVRHARGMTFLASKQPRDALAPLQTSLELARASHLRHQEAISLNAPATAHERLGDFATAEAHVRESIAIGETLEAWRHVVIARTHLGTLLREVGRPADAIRELERALHDGESRTNDPLNRIFALQELALALDAGAKSAEAADNLKAAQELAMPFARRQGNCRLLAAVVDRRRDVLVRLGRAEEELACVRSALQVAEDEHDPFLAGRLLTRIAEILPSA